MDTQKLVAYWRESALEDWAVAAKLVRSRHIRHGLFFGHLALEKLLKGIISLRTDEVPPRIHNLVRLAEIAGLDVSEQQLDILADMNAFNVEGRYPESLGPAPTRAEAREYLTRSEEVLKWLMSILSQ